MNKNFARAWYWLGGFGLGAGAMYYLDPQRGNRRRAEARQRVIHLVRGVRSAAEITSVDLRNRARGTVASARATFLDRNTPADDVLVARVRSRLGRLVSHPHSVEVTANNGKVTLRGICLASEVPRLVADVRTLRGVTGVENRIEAHASAEHIPALQSGASGGRRWGKGLDLLRARWSPATRFLVGLAGTGGVISGIAYGRKGKYLFYPIAVAGTLLLGRASTSEGFGASGILGWRRRFIRVQKTTNISAPVPQVYQFWANFANFPRFMSDVREVTVTPDGRKSHWVVEGPAGTTVSWDAVITRQVPNESISWRSMPGSAIQNAGRVRFRPNDAGGTRIDLDFSYHPPAGKLGHVAATVFGASPKGKLELALAQMKTLIEEGPSRRQIIGMHAQGA